LRGDKIPAFSQGLNAVEYYRKFIFDETLAEMIVFDLSYRSSSILSFPGDAGISFAFQLEEKHP
jgi:hypothetical protein